MKLVSIIMPVYNSSKFLKASLDSVICQTYSNWELIAIDDCSLDNSHNILLNYSKLDSRIRVHKNIKNLGVAKTRNYGVKISEGNWIAFLDSDDVWRNDKLEIQVNFLNSNLNASFLFTGQKFIDEMGNSLTGYGKVSDQVNLKQLRRFNQIACSSVIIKKDIIDKIGMHRDDIHEDYLAWLRILNVTPFAYGINLPLLFYRIRDNSRNRNKLASIYKTFLVHRSTRIGFFHSIYYSFTHVVNSLLKYNRVKKHE
jgi:teichuronic acid biosynthesis glycosyltransferase TuaG